MLSEFKTNPKSKHILEDYAYLQTLSVEWLLALHLLVQGITASSITPNAYIYTG
jgi:hypothetical protein